jgi:hypothetical protein
MALLLGWWWLAGKTLPLPPSGPESAVPVRTRRPENPPSVAPSPQRPEVEAGEAAFAQMKTTLAENRRAGMDQLAAMPASDELNVLVMRLLEDGVMSHRQAFDFITEMRDARWRDGMLKNLAIIMGREGDLEGLKLLEQLGAGSVRTGALGMFMAAYRPNSEHARTTAGRPCERPAVLLTNDMRCSRTEILPDSGRAKPNQSRPRHRTQLDAGFGARKTPYRYNTVT